MGGLILLAWGCAGDGPTDDTGLDTTPTTTATGTTGETAEVSTGSTADTGIDLPPGLFGTPPVAPVPPMAFFVAENSDGEGRGVSDLYDGTPTVLIYAEDTNQSAIAVSFHDVYSSYEVLGVRVVFVDESTPLSNLALVNLHAFRFEVWSDPDNELSSYYDMAPRSSRLLGPGGNVLLEYRPENGQVVPTSHGADVLADVLAIFGPEE